MFRVLRGVSGWFAACLLGFPVAAASPARAEDVYFHRTVAELTITDGRLPAAPDPRKAQFPGQIVGDGRIRSAIHPYAVIAGAGEIYLDDRAQGLAIPEGLDTLSLEDVVAFRIPDRREVHGRLFVPRGNEEGMVVVAFKVSPPKTQDNARTVFAHAKRRHYDRLLARNVPGTAWFRHQAREANALLPAGQADNRNVNGTPWRATDLERTFNLFSGDQAVEENLQIERPLSAPVPLPHYRAYTAGNKAKAEARVKTGDLPGISVAEMDWSARIKGKSPALDALADSIPADQHAVFVPGLKAAAAILSEFQGDAIPVLGLVKTRSEDQGVLSRYERQLGVSLADLGRFEGRNAIKSLAVTGSDPYLPSGTDLAVLIETEAPDDLKTFLKARLDEARRANPEAKDDGGSRDGVAYAGVRVPDRSLSSYVAVVRKVVVVTNSKAQLGRLIEVAQGTTPVLAGLPEYRFFRDRYPKGDGDESAFLVLTDATIRRWCGPRWRIGSSRRTLAAAALAEVQAEKLPRIVEKSKGDATPKAPPGSIDLGALRVTRAGVLSETYGTLEFSTPIVELALSEVETNEALAYARWRESYQQNWRGVFDPIAVRLSVRPDRLAADLTVMPLIAGTQYRTFIDLVGGARLKPDAGNRHAGSLAHAVLALDVESALFRQGGSMISSLTHVPQQVVLGWLGGSVAVYLDDDPFWKDLAAAEKPREFLSKQANRLPAALQVEVTNGAKLALFLTGLRAFVDQSAPNVTRWENRDHGGQRYVRVSETEGARPGGDGPRFALYYHTSPRSLTLSLNEDVIKRAIDRQAGKAETGKTQPPWLGESLALQIGRRGFEVLGIAGRTEFHDELQVRSWGNLPILNEWKRLFPDRDPVALHQAVWGTTLVDPGGGRYAWNPRWATMESTVFGHPGEPKAGHDLQNPVSRFGSVRLGVSFEKGGLRAKTAVDLLPKP